MPTSLPPREQSPITFFVFLLKNKWLRLGTRLGLFFLLLFSSGMLEAKEQALKARVLPGDSVQMVLWQISRRAPEMVTYIPETRRWFLNDTRRAAIADAWLLRLQDAFYYDVSGTCQFYGRKYLADWKALMAKAARETFWGASYLCNRTNNYFGLRRTNKEWMCESFFFCDIFIKNDPEPTDFVIFPNFESCLWMFVHTIYSRHYLDRLPDFGDRVAWAINFERTNRVRYWQPTLYGTIFAEQLQGYIYTDEELIYTWSEHAINNFCVNCTRQTDREWVNKIWVAASRARI